MAADVITRFKLETTQFDSKLRDTAKELQGIARQAEKAGKDFAGFDKGAVEAARALGTVASGATNTKDKLKDLVGSFNDAAKAYNKLTEEQKQSDFGKAMAESLQKLQQEIKQTKDELYGLGDAAKGKGGGGLFGGKGITDMLSVAGGNLIASGIGKLTSELTETVQQSIELARSGEGVRLAFDRLNQPGLLNNLKEATHGTVSELELMKAAVKFDDFKLPVEQLGTLLAFAQKKAKDTGQSVDYMVDSIVTGLGRKSLMILDNLGLSASQVKDRMAETGDMTTAVASIIKEQMSEAGEYVETASDRAARAAADAQNQMEELGRKAMPVAEEWGKAWNEIKISGMEIITFVLTPIAESLKDIREILSGEYTLKIKAEYDTPLGSNVDDNGNYIKRPANGNWAGFDAENGTWKPGYSGAIYNSATGQTELPEVTINGQKRTKTKRTKTTGGGSKAKVPTVADFEKFNMKTILGADALKGSDDANFLSVWANTSDEAKKKFMELNTEVTGLNETFNNLTEWTINFNPFDEMTKKLKQEQMAFNMAGQAAQSFGSAIASIGDPSAAAAGTVIQAIANIALGFSQAAAQASSMGPYGWIAYLAAGMGAMATTISTIHSLTGYANGGEIKGNSYSGDNLMAMGPSGLIGLNAGEIILNRAQQSNVASGLQGAGSLRGLNLRTKVKGTELLVWLDNSLAQSGRGELVTWGQ